MEPELITTADLGRWLSMGYYSAIDFVQKQLGVEPITIQGHFKKGRLRWRRSQIMKALDTLQAAETTQPAYQGQFDKPVSELAGKYAQG